MSNTLTKIGGSARFSAIATHAGQIHLAGQVSQLKDAGIEEQSADVFAKVDVLLAEAGSDRRHIISVQVWLSNMDDYAGFNAAWDTGSARSPLPRASASRRAWRNHTTRLNCW